MLWEDKGDEKLKKVKRKEYYKSNDPGEYISIYDSNLYSVSKNQAGLGSSTYFSDNSVDPGTYYLRVSKNIYVEDVNTPYLYTLKWK